MYTGSSMRNKSTPWCENKIWESNFPIKVLQSWIGLRIRKPDPNRFRFVCKFSEPGVSSKECWNRVTEEGSKVSGAHRLSVERGNRTPWAKFDRSKTVDENAAIDSSGKRTGSSNCELRAATHSCPSPLTRNIFDPIPFQWLQMYKESARNLSHIFFLFLFYL